MRIKLLTKAIVSSFGQEPLPRSAVIESTDEAHVAEFKALVAVNYAAETKEAVTHTIDGKAQKAAGISGIDANDDAHWKALEGNIGEVTDYLGTLDADGIKRVAKLEASAKGQQRTGVAAAAEKASAALSSEG
jgi:hypothetical protein